MTPSASSDSASRIFVIIDISTYWMHGTGGGGEDFDSVILRDDDGFPTLKGRHVRGLLREASRRLEAWGRVGNDWGEGLKHGSITELLFGSRSGPGRRNIRLAPPGVLEVPSLFRLPPEVLELGKDKTSPFSCGIASTSVDWDSGAATDKSLRTMEAAVPCLLGGWIGFDDEARLMIAPEDEETVRAAQEIWVAHLEMAALEVRAVGAKRTRGFGRSLLQVAHVEPVKTEAAAAAPHGSGAAS